MLENALRLHQAGQLAEAEAIYRKILAIDARHADSLHLLGMIEQQRGAGDAAVEMIRKAIAINPNEAAYHSNLGTILQAQAKFDEAVACFERALALSPEWAEVHSNLGNVLQTQGKFEEAAACQQRALSLKPDCAEAWSNLGIVRQAQGQLKDAVACYESALALKPDYADAHNNLGNALTTLDKLDDAVAHYERALMLKPDWAYAHNNLGNVLAIQNSIEDAQAHYERAIFLKPDYANAHNNLGNILKELGRFEAAMAHYGRAIAIQPDYAEAHLNRTEIKSFEPGDADLAALEALAGTNELSAHKALHIHFALGKALDDVGDYPRAWEHLLAGNALKRRQIHYDEKAVFQLSRRIFSVFDRSLFQQFEGQGDHSSAPVFVVGMPRSGSTLIEQILSSHPQIHGAGELTALEKMQLAYPEQIPQLDGAGLRRLGQWYLACLPQVNSGKVRIVDKLLGNVWRIGLIRLMLPNARIIHITRSPMDTCVSCYSKLFTFGLYFSYDLAELGRHYRVYSELMGHWRSVLPAGAMLDVAYEDVVDDLEGQARRLIDYCGLPWDDRCIGFHQSSRPVRTASAVQVRRPLYRSSVQRWRRYENGLGPLLDALADPLP
ncbi:MAG TPA: tetratricopeptide repeat protein [Bryobacteraceae bacterium]|nr:tetratricopeptide repeat protein [Bryobacteraceae bacterium]